MQCVDETKEVSMFKKIIPFLIGGLVTAALIYLFHPKKIETLQTETLQTAPLEDKMSTVELVTAPQCPEVAECPAVQVCPQVMPLKPIIVKEIVYIKRSPGCYVDWKTGEMSGFSNDGLSLKCTFDMIKKTVNTEFSRSAFKVRQEEAFRRLQ